MTEIDQYAVDYLKHHGTEEKRKTGILEDHSELGGREGLSVKVDITFGAMCEKCKAYNKKTVLYYELGADITLTCSCCDKVVSFRLQPVDIHVSPGVDRAPQETLSAREEERANKNNKKRRCK